MAQQSITIEILRDPQTSHEQRESAIAAGERARETVELLPDKSGHTAVEAVEAWLRPLNPVRTGEQCVYAFDAPERGSGTVKVHITGSIYRARMDDRVQLLEIARELGRLQPARLSNSAFWNYSMRLQVRSPYLQILFGLLMIVALGLPTLMRAYDNGLAGAADWSVFVAGAAVTLLAGYLWVYRGLRCLNWWHSARGVVKRGGEKLPEDLRVIA